MQKTLKEKTETLVETFKKNSKVKIIGVISVLLIIAAIFLLSAATVTSMSGSIVFNEVLSGNSKSIGNGETGSLDWIELYNASNSDVDLSGYRLSDSSNSAGTELINAVIPKGEYLIIYASKEYIPKDKVLCFVNFGISSSGETLYLINDNNAVVSQLTVPALNTDVSYARKEDGTYGFCTEPTPGMQNAEKIMDADELSSMLGSGGLILSEAMPKANNDETWVEIFNSGSSDVYLGNYCLTDTENDKVKWHLPGHILKSGEYDIISLSEESTDGTEMQASFNLGTTDTSIYLYDVTGNFISALKWDKDIPCGISVIGDNCYTAYPTKGEENSKETLSAVAKSSMDDSDPVRINEVLPKNAYSICDTDGDRCEWVELFNSGSENISLKGYFLSDDENDLLKWAFPDIVIQPGTYKIIFLSGKQGSESELHASFRLSGGESVYLTNTKGFRVDCLPLPATIGDNISVGRDKSGKPLYYAFPTPGNTNAKSFEDPSLIGFFDNEGIYISEVCAANKAKSGINDWIELYNGSDNDSDISGYYISDDINNPKKWSVASALIKAKGYTVIEASPGNKEGAADFGISPSGENIILSDKQGEILDIFDTGMLETGVTSGRVEGDSSIKRVFFDKPTRGEVNSKTYLYGYTQTPLVSDNVLYHKERFSVEITCTTPGATIFYTTDGSVPTNGSKKYTQPIVMSENTPLRAIAYSEGLLPSQITTTTYLFDNPHSVPVFCIAGIPAEMNYLLNTDNNKKPEFAAYVEYFEKDGTLGVSFPSGLRPKGKSSLGLPQNSLALSLRSDYGQKSVCYPFFNDSNITEYTNLALRSGGQDSVYSKVRDSYIQAVCKGLDLDGIRTKTVVVYVNGKYCGLYELNEEQNDNYVKTYYGIEKDNIDMVKTKGEVLYGDNNEYNHICQIARSWDMSDDKVFEEFAKYVDVDACTDYLIAQIYFGNGDIVNQRYWRARDYTVKWRPLFFDMDYCLRFNEADRNVFSRYLMPNPSIGGVDIENNPMTVEMYIFSALKQNKAWRDKFVERFVELSVTQFDTERILKIYDGMVNTIRPEIEQHIARWHTPSSMNFWSEQIADLRSALEKRQDIAIRQLKSYFNVPDETIQKYIDKYSKKQ